MHELRLAFIGFGEAGQAFASGLTVQARGYDRKTDAAATRHAKCADGERCGVLLARSNAEAVADVEALLSLVTADQALEAARETAYGISPGALFLDMNSVAPATKRAAATAIEAAGGRYIDVAIMAPVLPARREVPLLVSGCAVEQAMATLCAVGFGSVRSAGGQVGSASSVKMIRSVMIKGMEALSAECVSAAHAAGVLDEVVASLDASWLGIGWRQRLDYNLDRMIVHGRRRAAEMEEVVVTLDSVRTSSAMTRGTMEWQSAVGGRSPASPSGLDAKARLLTADPKHCEDDHP